MHKILLSYVPLGCLISFGFNYAELCTAVNTKSGKLCSIHAAYNQSTNTQIIIGYTEGERREWFFDAIPNMSDEDLQGSRNSEWCIHVVNLPVRKNRVAGRDLLQKLRELESAQSQPSCTPTPFRRIDAADIESDCDE